MEQQCPYPELDGRDLEPSTEHLWFEADGDYVIVHVGHAIGVIGESRTLGYAEHGAAGMLTLFVRGMLCNWMVSTGVVGAMISTTVSGKVIAMWMPIMLFFYMVFEHSIVNMFLFPMALMMGGEFTILDYFWWNEIPTVLGNLVGGLTFVGLTLYSTHYKPGAKRRPA